MKYRYTYCTANMHIPGFGWSSVGLPSYLLGSGKKTCYDMQTCLGRFRRSECIHYVMKHNSIESDMISFQVLFHPKFCHNLGYCMLREL